MTRALIVVAAVALLASPYAQSTVPTYEAAAIRLNETGASGGGGRPRAGGGYTWTNVPIRTLIGSAFDFPFDRIVGGPSWTETDRYDINIIGIGGEIRRSQDARPMTHAMLRERFTLETHVEQRELDVYLLARLRPNGPLGANLRQSAIPCSDREARTKAKAPPCMIRFDTGTFTAVGAQVTNLLSTLTSASGRAVLDRTGLTGEYDFDLKWTAAPEPGTDAVSIFTAVQEQLGLKLESGKAMLDVLVIDRIERPTEN